MHDTVKDQLVAEWVFILEIIILIIIIISWYYGEKKEINKHKKIIQIMLVLQTIFITYMINSLINTDFGSRYIMHAVLGMIIYIYVIYTYLAMAKILPKALRVPAKYRKAQMKSAGI